MLNGQAWSIITNKHVTNKQTRQYFKIYNLDNYTSQLAQKHGLQYDSDSEWNIKHLQDITKMLSIETFLNEKVYKRATVHV